MGCLPPEVGKPPSRSFRERGVCGYTLKVNCAEPQAGLCCCLPRALGRVLEACGQAAAQTPASEAQASRSPSHHHSCQETQETGAACLAVSLCCAAGAQMQQVQGAHWSVACDLLGPSHSPGATSCLQALEAGIVQTIPLSVSFQIVRGLTEASGREAALASRVGAGLPATVLGPEVTSVRWQPLLLTRSQ